MAVDDTRGPDEHDPLPRDREDAHPEDTHRSGRPQPDPRQRSEALKERIYVTFTALAVTIAVGRDTHHATAGTAALTLLLTVVGTLLAVFVADLVAHMIREGSLPTRDEIHHLLWVSFGSLAVLGAPMVLLGLQVLGAVDLPTALRLISVVLSATLVLVTLVAVRRLRLRTRSTLLVLTGMAVLGAAVLVVELAVH